MSGQPEAPSNLFPVNGHPGFFWTPDCTVGDDWIISASLWAKSIVLGSGRSTCRMKRVMRPVAHLSVPDLCERGRHCTVEEVGSWIATKAMKSGHLEAIDLRAALHDLSCLAAIVSYELGEEASIQMGLGWKGGPEDPVAILPDGPILPLPKSLSSLLGCLSRKHDLYGHRWSTEAGKLPHHGPRPLLVAPAAIGLDEARNVILARLADKNPVLTEAELPHYRKLLQESAPADWRIKDDSYTRVRKRFDIPGSAGYILEENDEHGVVILQAERLTPHETDDRPVSLQPGLMPMIRIDSSQRRDFSWRRKARQERVFTVDEPRLQQIARELRDDDVAKVTIEDYAVTLAYLSGTAVSISTSSGRPGLASSPLGLSLSIATKPAIAFTEQIRRNLEIVLDGFSWPTKFSYYHDGLAHPGGIPAAVRGAERSAHETLWSVGRVEAAVKRMTPKKRAAWAEINRILTTAEDTNRAA